MKGGEPLTMREASFISSLMGHAQHIDAATVRFTMHIDGSLDGQTPAPRSRYEEVAEEGQVDAIEREAEREAEAMRVRIEQFR